MWRAEIKNHAFDRFGESFQSVVDSSHFLGRSAFDIPYPQRNPSANMRESSNIFELEMAVPGFAKDELEIHLRDDILTIQGGKSRSNHQGGAEIILEEFAYDAFERTFKLTPDIAAKKISASFSSGIIKLIFDTSDKTVEPRFRKIRIE